jgi:hypothetical protein
MFFFQSLFGGPRIFFDGIDASMFVLDCFFELTLVGSLKALAIIHLDTILVAEGLKSWHTGAVSLESVGLAVDDEIVAIKILHGGISDCLCHCNLGKCTWIGRGCYFFCQHQMAMMSLQHQTQQHTLFYYHCCHSLGWK